LNQNIAVSLLENQVIEIYDDLEDLSDPIEDDDCTLEEVAGPSSPKRMCKSDNAKKGDTQITSQQLSRSSSGVSLCIEVKARNRSSLTNLNVIDQVIAQTITNAFSQVNKTPALSGWLIPTFGCTLDNVIVLFYDPKNDVLLQCVHKIPIWGRRDCFYIPSIVQIWILLNFTVFTFKDLADDYELNSSNFHGLAKNKLEDYRKIKSGKAFNPTYDCDSYSDVLIRMKNTGKRAHKKLKAH
jgi:hypothetical protein